MSLELARKRARLFFQYHKLSLPVDIEKILNSYASVEETYIPIEGDAICINNIEMPHIIIKSNMSPYRKRFTYAHELAHLQIPSHTGMISCTTEFSDSIDMSAYYKMEQEANAFAAELLMPSDWLASLISTHMIISRQEVRLGTLFRATDFLLRTIGSHLRSTCSYLFFVFAQYSRIFIDPVSIQNAVCA